MTFQKKPALISSIHRIGLLSLLALGTMTIAGCAQYDNAAMAGDAVDIPDDPPLSKQPPVITAPTPSPTPKESVRQLLGQ